MQDDRIQAFLGGRPCAGEGKEKAYQSRAEGILATCDMLDEFLKSPEEDV